MIFKKTTALMVAVFAVLFCTATAQAQLFRNAPWNQTKQVGASSGCPNGQCPTASSQQPGHWSFPGTIESHLESTHGVATAGMTRQQKLNLHDSLHEGTSENVVVSVPRANYVVPFVSSYPTPAKALSGGGSSGGSFRVGNRDSLGDVITSIGPVLEASPSVAPALPEAMESRRSRKASREAILESVTKAESEGTITGKQAEEIRRAAKRPRMLAQMESLIAEKAKAEGYALPMGSDGEVQMGAIPWADLADFITKIAPLIFKLIDLFSSDIDLGIFRIEQFVNLESVPQAYPDEWYEAA